MKLILVSIITSIGFFCCSNNVKQDLPKTLKITCNYWAFCKHDSTKKEFTWQKFSDLRITVGGPNVFTWHGDSTFTMETGSKKARSINHFTKANLTKTQAKKVPSTLLNGKFKLKGVYEQDDNKNSGYYFAYYINGNSILLQLHETIGFLAEIMYFSETPINEFEEAGVIFPYRNSIKF